MLFAEAITFKPNEGIGRYHNNEAPRMLYIDVIGELARKGDTLHTAMYGTI